MTKKSSTIHSAGLGTGARHLSILVLVCVALTFAAACDQGGGDADEESEKSSTLPPPVVDLPEPPTAEQFVIPEKNDDGTLRVEGIIENRDDYLDKKVEIKGVVVQVSEECDPKEAREKGEKCPEPHFYIKDEVDARKQLLVVGYDQEFVERVELEPGEEVHLFGGTYALLGRGFAATEDGLLKLDAIDEKPVIEEED
jgi:hypothetical protein